MGVFVSAHGWAGQGHYKFFSLLARRGRKSRAQKIAEARRVGALAALPLKYSSNFFVKTPQVVK
ncbi:hypothetical protein A3F45_00050 [Candidatus Curtissbacteria bacterium RIFCSPHIGHO2_12_FULL_41_17]|uniref:Uncharacterized protein n=1 Tax=Candidatus Curtissbacteria bacterium RIFCSPHIGHO2_12_FULL_41_17 TaxID=1797722 RepID=A0A1F5HJL8_9BACT|nr:MAG: hypothetical protein A3F45_00050 [Candidatus Curtissbacteria bacterium RIFCSPHIGHO2_12_FULL_41_17]